MVTITLSSDTDDRDPTPAPHDELNDAPVTTRIVPKKRKSEAVVGEKVLWTDSEPDEPDNRTTAKRKRGNASKGRTSIGTGPLRRGRPRKSNGAAKPIKAEGQSGDEEDYPEADIPDYLRRRRWRFIRERERLKEAGLKLPPDYTDIYFSDNERPSARLERRPKFDEASGIKPSRPYKEIELYSAGVIPASIAQYLRDYQVDGVRFLHQRFILQKGCILGDDMGLGKTIQVAAFLTAAFGKTGDERDGKRMRKMRRAGEGWYPRVLIICPGSLLKNWENELNRWGWWHVDEYHGAGKEDVLQSAKSGMTEIMITTYKTYTMSQEAVNEVEWDCVVADECHYFKGRRSDVTQAMDKVNALCRIGLTGTAIQNNYEELWTLLNWTNPGHFGPLTEWKQIISKPLAIGQSHDANPEQLAAARKTAEQLVFHLLPDFFLRRMKTLIAHQLPRKRDKVVFCPLTEIQTEAYRNFVEGENVAFIKAVSTECECGSGVKRGWCCHKRLPDGRPWTSIFFPCMMTLQKLANHLTLLIPSTNEHPDKKAAELKVFQTCLPDVWEDLYEKRESLLNLTNPRFCGKWKVLQKLLRVWHDEGDKVLVFSHSFVFLISTRAGGVGLNITSANKVVIFDPHWNPAYDQQAQDRAYRIGQVRDVDVFRLISAGTIEETVYARQIYKQQQANIAYTASKERRYFKGVQNDKTRKGEIFGIENIFSFREDHVMLKDIVNKTNVAEAKAGVMLTEFDVEKKEEEEADDDDVLSLIKQEDKDDTGGVATLAKLLTAENPDDAVAKAQKARIKARSDAIAGILSSAGVIYTHENSEVIGTSRVEQQLSKRAEQAALQGIRPSDPRSHTALFADGSDEEEEEDDDGDDLGQGEGGGRRLRLHYRFHPPEDVMRRQFCSMAKEFGFESATEFALVVENWTQEQRRDCLDAFYRAREKLLMKREEEPEVVVIGGAGTSIERRVKEEEEVKKGDDAQAGSREAAKRRASTVFMSDDDEDDELVDNVSMNGGRGDEDKGCREGRSQSSGG
ncbi:SNF2 family N-terminal domain-containing protein [Schizothecium vesticola]|uniref:SNF2 family N-terminal domain-containing protein n=1 Tax=Schizothecium vesticola TaxID=314040 RepID=A0AA40FBA3_9PEZI|nr:SNF2 family N-terminal domain-containing protein [Schizothecium vesticola]